MTPFAALQGLCGLSNREAAEFLRCSEVTVNKLRSGARGARAGRDYLIRLQALWASIDQAAVEAAEEIASLPGVMDESRAASLGRIELGYPADDAEARALGLPCVGAWRQYAARVIDELMIDGLDPGRIRLVPRGATPATAAAIEAREAAG